MSHIQVNHSVILVGPYDGEVAKIHYILDTQWIVLGR